MRKRISRQCGRKKEKERKGGWTLEVQESNLYELADRTWTAGRNRNYISCLSLRYDGIHLDATVVFPVSSMESP